MSRCSVQEILLTYICYLWAKLWQHLVYDPIWKKEDPQELLNYMIKDTHTQHTHTHKHTTHTQTPHTHNTHTHTHTHTHACTHTHVPQQLVRRSLTSHEPFRRHLQLLYTLHTFHGPWNCSEKLNKKINIKHAMNNNIYLTLRFASQERGGRGGEKVNMAPFCNTAGNSL